MSRMTIVRGAVVVLATVMMLLGAVPAQAAVASHITAVYNNTTEHFHGKVTSANAECIAHRTVRLYRHRASGNVLVGTGTSRSGGRWTIAVMHAHGKYVAKIRTEVEMGVTCGGAKSGVVDVM